jgi:hypothetical protein
MMAEDITYYAIVDDLSSRERPAGVLRRVKHDEGERDETFGTDLRWAPSSLLYEHEYGDLGNKFIPITEHEANRIIARIRDAAGPGEQG